MSALHGPVVDGAAHCAPGETAEQGPEVPAYGAHAPAEMETGRGTAHEARAPPSMGPSGESESKPDPDGSPQPPRRAGRGALAWGVQLQWGCGLGPALGGGLICPRKRRA